MVQPHRVGYALGLCLFAATICTAQAGAQDGRFDLGLRANVMAGNGEPTNDVPSFGLVGHYGLNNHWSLGFALDHSPEFDVERSAKIIGFEQDPTQEEIDQIGTSTTLTAWLERSYGDRFEWLWGIGAGISDVEIDPLEGRRANGAPFRIETEAGTELLLIGNAGFRYWFGERWAVSTEIRAEQRYGDWKLVDVRSGETGSIGDYLLTGIHFGLHRRF